MAGMRMAIARNIREARKRLGLKQHDLAEAIDRSVQIISQIETGNREVKAWELSLIAKRLHVEFTDLLSEEGPEYGPAPLWRKEPDAGKAEIEFDLRLRSQRYRAVMELTSECPSAELPRASGLDPLGASYSKVRELAESMHRRLRLGDRPAQLLLPTLEEEYGVMVFYQDLGEGGSGISVWGPYGPAMLLNSREAPWRRNFSCGHELFHLITWDDLARDKLDGDRDLSQQIERNANVFASALLLPRGALAEVLQEHSTEKQIQVAHVIQIAREFGVSTSALLWAMVNWGFVPKQTPDDLLTDRGFKSQDRRTMPPGWWTPPPLPERFVRLAYVAYRQGDLSRARLASILDTTVAELPSRLELYDLDLESNVAELPAMRDRRYLSLEFDLAAEATVTDS